MMEFYNKHYIRVVDGIVTKGFSDAFEEPTETDICINEKGGRHFEIDEVINPQMFDDNFCHLYRYDGALRKATEDELKAEREANYVEPEPTEAEITLELLADHEYRLCMMELGMV